MSAQTFGPTKPISRRIPVSRNPVTPVKVREVATAPFDKRCSADVIFRTSNDVDFYLHKNILSLASTFFETMFSLAQTPATTLPDPATLASGDPDLPIVEVSEDSLTLEHILRYCYPVRDPVVADLPLLDRVLGAAIKYALEAVIELTMDSLRRFIADEPLQVFVIACRHSCEDEARLAAETLKGKEQWVQMADTFAETVAGRCYIPEMGDISAYTYYHLIRFLLHGLRSGFKFCHSGTPHPFGQLEDASYPTSIYPFNQPSTDLVIRSTDGLDFRVHRIMVEMQIAANPVYPLQGILLSPPLSGVDFDGLPVIQSKESSLVLGPLLRLCYPSTPGRCILNWNATKCFMKPVIDVIAAALRYGLTSIVDLYQARLKELSSHAPLGVYCVSIAFGWFELASAVAYEMALSTNPFIGLYWQQLELLTAAEYRRYLEYWHTIQKTMYTTVGYSLFLPISQWKDVREIKEMRVQPPVVEWALNQVAANPTKRPSMIQLIAKNNEMDSSLHFKLKEVHLSLN